MTNEQLMIAAALKLITIWGPVVLTSFAVFPIAKRFF
jgi:hypothetical protein